MAEFPVEIHFNSVAEFEAVYRPVKDFVLLFDAESGKIIAANNSFRQTRKEELSKLNISDLFNLRNFKDGQKEETLQKGSGAGAGSESNPEVLSVRLAGKLVKMVFVPKQDTTAIREEKQLPDQAEKIALLNEVYHRVKNNLNIIVSLLSLQLNRVTEPYTRHLLLESKSRIYTLSLLQQKLYSSSRISEIKAGSYLQSLSLSVLSSFRKPGQEISLRMEAEDEWLNIDTLMPVGLITHELVTNAVLHAFPDQTGGEIHIFFKNLGEGQFLLKVADNGIGLPVNKKPEDYDSLGFQLIKNLLRQLKAEWQVSSEPGKGSVFLVQFKEAEK